MVKVKELERFEIMELADRITFANRDLANSLSKEGWTEADIDALLALKEIFSASSLFIRKIHENWIQKGEKK